MSRKITIEHNGTTYYCRPAAITSTAFGLEDHGILTAYVTLDGDGWGISVGGYGLDEWNDAEGKRRAGWAARKEADQ